MSEPTVYAIASGKGGVGKTTTAINLGAMLADRGHEVVVVDTDLGMANLADFLDFEIEDPTLHEVLAGDADFERAVSRAPGDIDVLPSGVDIEAFAKSDPTNLQGVVADLREEYDYVLLDTGAGVSYDTLVPLALADGVLLVATPDVASVRDTAKTGELAERVESEVSGAVLTQRSSDILNADDVEATLGTDVLAVVPADEAVPMGIDAGRPLAAFAPNAPAGQAYRELAAVLTGEADPDPELDLGDESDGEGSEADSTETAEDAFDGSALAENVREAAKGGDRSEGLLGGELATAADEIRKQAGDSSGASGGAGDDREIDREGAAEAATEGKSATRAESATQAESATGSAPEGASDAGTSADVKPDETAASPDAGGGAEPSDATEETGDARSVEDLIDEHISDERLGGSATASDDDPLAQMSEELADESEDGSGDGERVADERDPLVDGTDDAGAAADTGAAADAGAADDATATRDAGETMDFDTGDPDDAASSSGDVPFENGDRVAEAGREAETGGDGLGSESETGADRGEEIESERDAETAIEEPFDPDESDDRDDEGGLLGRLGSLFK